MDSKKLVTATMFALTLGLGLVACEEHKGPAERAGEKIDHAVEEAKDEVD